MQLPPSTNPREGQVGSGAAAALPGPQLKAILVSTDFSVESLAGVRCAVALAGQFGGAASVVHIVEPPSRLAGMEAVALARTDEEVAALAMAELVALAKHESVKGVQATACVRVGTPFHEITTAAREAGVDLIVIATHGRGGWQHALMGSTAERVVRHAACPVLTVPARETPPQAGSAAAFRPRKILVPLDFSTVSEAALPWAVFLAEHYRAELLLIHVTEKFPLDYLLGRELTDSTVKLLMTQAEAGLQRMAVRLGKSNGWNPCAVVRTGSPPEEICLAAKALGVDLIVLTTHGYTGLKHVWLGSTAERVVRHACCPVLTVRATN